MKKLLRPLALLSSLLALGSLAACASEDPGPGGDGDGDGEVVIDTQFPAESTLEGIEAFLEAGYYKEWNSDPAIRGSDEITNAHGDYLRVYINEQGMLADMFSGPNGSMAVKELYNAAGELVGRAAAFKDGEDEVDWMYYCTEDEGERRCTGREESSYPMFGGSMTSCGICHGDGIFAPKP